LDFRFSDSRCSISTKLKKLKQCHVDTGVDTQLTGTEVSTKTHLSTHRFLLYNKIIPMSLIISAASNREANLY
jgi:hypothetical protein